jgi:hypothetical protein
VVRVGDRLAGGKKSSGLVTSVDPLKDGGKDGGSVTVSHTHGPYSGRTSAMPARYALKLLEVTLKADVFPHNRPCWLCMVCDAPISCV